MRTVKRTPIRNRLDLTDARQVRTIKKRLGVTEHELRSIVDKIGDSIAAISKEVDAQKLIRTGNLGAAVASNSHAEADLKAATVSKF
ncbi:MAG: DUF3606 domain-containing protein [Bradyrhizobium sp.]|uniref:DUF3606 domain-containing protein n=1 Tax=Bradyrhizobium sp. TaxID=376 RepID=UPI0025C42BCC|nr:DUF3606 domain-containing protein [Bradyrhizobium sp.]MBI5262573.1 DUF3606 domain-containing protein [Bradyrhizobium sp.]